MAAYSHNLNDVTLAMTSNVLPSPLVASASSEVSGYSAYKAFDHAANGWQVAATTTSWLKIYSGGATWTVTSYTISSTTGWQGKAPKNWALEVSSNNIDWTVVDTQTNQTAWISSGEMRTFSLSTPAEGSYFRLSITNNNGDASYTHVGELELIFIETKHVAEDSASIDSVSGYINSIISISESIIASVLALGSKDFEIDGVAETPVVVDAVDAIQDYQIGSIDETPEPTDAAGGRSFLDITIPETVSQADTAAAYFVTTGTTSEEATQVDAVNVLKWTGVTIEVSDALIVYDSAVYRLGLTIADTLGLSDSTAAMLGILVSEYLTMLDAQVVKHNGTKTIADGIFLEDDIKKQLALIISDVLELTDTAPTVMLQLLLTEFIALSETITLSRSGTITVSDTIAVTDSSPLIAFILAISESISFTSIPTNVSRTEKSINDSLTLTDITSNTLALTVLEYLGFTELVSTISSLSRSVTDTLYVSDGLSFGVTQTLSETLSLVDTASIFGLLLNTITESFALSEAVAAQLRVVLPITETLTLSDTVSSQGILYNVIYDTLHLNVTVEMDGEVWECYVLNTPKFLPSIYSGFNFNSYCVFDNRAYGCKSDGIYELTGDTDNGVVFHTGVQLSETKFGIPNQKRFRKAYVGTSGTSPAIVMETETGDRKVYSIDSDGEVDASRALRSKKWKLTVTDFSTLDFIKLIPVVLAK